MMLMGAIKKFSGVALTIYALHTALGTGNDTLSALFDMVKIHVAQLEMNQFHKVLMSFYIRESRYPNKENGELLAWFEESYDQDIHQVELDPWDSLYYFLIPGYEVTCSGPDRQHLSRDDILYLYPSGTKNETSFR